MLRRERVKGPLQRTVASTTKYFISLPIGVFLQQYPDIESQMRYTNRATVIERLM